MEEVVGSIPTRSTIFTRPESIISTICHSASLAGTYSQREVLPQASQFGSFPWPPRHAGDGFVGKESSSSGTGVTGFLQQEQKARWVFLINFMMPFFGRRQAFVLVAVGTHIFLQTSSLTGLARNSCNRWHRPHAPTALHRALSTGPRECSWSSCSAFSSRHCVDPIRSRHFDNPSGSD